MHVGRADLVLEDVPAPEPVGDQVVVKVAGAGVCHSDLYVLDGAFPVELEHLPVTMGHEIAGWIEGAGPNAKDVRLGEAVAVMVGWGCGTCRWCVRGHEQICPEGDEAGSTKDGGFAEFVLVPHRRHLVSLGSLDPVSAAPLGDAALSSYAAVKRVAPVPPRRQRARRHRRRRPRPVRGSVRPAAHRGDRRRRRLAARSTRHRRDAGRSLRCRGRCRVAGARTQRVGPEEVGAVIDFVGTDDSLELACSIVGRRGIVALLGLAGGSTTFGFDRLAPEAVLTTVHAGTIADLQEVVALARLGRLESRVTAYPLEAINQALADLRNGVVEGRCSRGTTAIMNCRLTSPATGADAHKLCQRCPKFADTLPVAVTPARRYRDRTGGWPVSDRDSRGRRASTGSAGSIRSRGSRTGRIAG